MPSAACGALDSAPDEGYARDLPVSDPSDHAPEPSGLVPATPPPAAQPPALRASDGDRERVVEVLRQAAGEGRIDVDELDERLQLAYTMRTLTELESLTADVTVPEPDARATPVTTPHGIVVRPGEGGTSMIASIMSGHERSGRWRIAPHCRVINIMGGSELDLTQAELSDRVTTLNVLSILGGCEIRVPEGVDVQVSKLGLMGGNGVELSDTPVPPGGPVIHIRLVSILGGASVETGPKKTRDERRRERELRKAKRRDELGE
jgi:hypothetical protein